MYGLKARLPAFLLIGTLSFFYAEIFSGASRVWFLDPGSMIITFPIYLSHIVLLLNVAFRAGKMSICHLYLLGVLFGLYESWITQVLWHGYYGADTVTIIAGIAIYETIVLTLFWHPIFSFIIPILVFQLLACSFSNRNLSCDLILTSHETFLMDSKRNRILLLIIVLSGSVFMTFNYGGDLVMIGMVLIGSYAIIMILAWYIGRNTGVYDLSVLAVQRIWPLVLFILSSYLIFFYLSGLQGFLSDGAPRIPEFPGVVIILLIYGLIIGLFILSPRKPLEYSDGATIIPLTTYAGFAIIHLILSASLAISYMLAPTFLTALMFILYMFMIPGGLYCLGLVIKVMIRSRHPRYSNPQ